MLAEVAKLGMDTGPSDSCHQERSGLCPGVRLGIRMGAARWMPGPGQVRPPSNRETSTEPRKRQYIPDRWNSICEGPEACKGHGEFRK